MVTIQRHRFQVAAIFKSRDTDVRHVLWNSYAGKTTATIEGQVTKTCYTIPNGDGLHISAIIKSITSDTRYGFRNIDAGIDRMAYKEGITVLNFPYISVFNKAELKEYSAIDTFGLE